ncbi:MAG: septum site-determining protein MinD [Clostridia bacterium]|nr:septum site-determining protein MinD [Clostridia bacterium]
MGEIIVVASGKGGVGKTALTAGIGEALDSYDKKVLLIDTDMGLRNLDIALGVENEVVFDVLDCIDGRCGINDALIKISCKNGGLSFLPAAQSRGGKHADAEKFSSFCSGLKNDFDFIILDSPAGLGIGLSSCCCDSAIVVVQPYIASVRDADRCIDILERNNISGLKLVINGVRPELISKGIMWNVDDIVDLLGIPLLGIVPFDDELLKGALANKQSIAFEAFGNIAGRMAGENIPVIDINRKKIGLTDRIKKFLKK